VLIFYIFGNFFQLTPKTNLVIFTTIFSVLDFYLRIIVKRYFIKYGVDRKIIIVNNEKNNLITELEENQNIGYKIIKEIPTLNLEEITNLKPDAIVIDTAEEIELEKIYSITKKEISVYTVNDFYEEVFQKIPTENIAKNDIVSYIGNSSTIFNSIKRFTDIVFSFVLTIVLSPILLVTGFLIKITSRGPVLIKQKRVTKNEEIFTLYKFRSMVALSTDGQAEKNGAVWTANNNTDPRITSLGRFIRKTHLDELPQLINILKGDISFVGPRPERPEFIINLRKDILHYDLRHSVKAGLTGWAQVNYKYGASIEDAREKLKYDFYYIKNKNIFFDFLILLKTVAEIFRY
jgi:lipopolysaccharide/colanic/teichoic acid biosynthesis glycosyltransferase